MSAQSPQSEPRKPFIISRKKPIATYTFIGLCVLVFISDYFVKLYLAWQYNIEVDLLKIYGMKINEFIVQGQFWRLVTAIFLHADLTHIGFNMLALYIWGRHIETLYGRGRFIAIFFMSGILATAASFAFTANNSLGASGAIYGLLGGLLYLRKYNKTLFNKVFGAQLLIYLAFSLFMGFSMPSIDNVGHIGGLLGGYIAARAVGLLTQKFEKRKEAILFYIAYFVLFAAFMVIGFLR